MLLDNYKLKKNKEIKWWNQFKIVQLVLNFIDLYQRREFQTQDKSRNQLINQELNINRYIFWMLER